VRILTNILLITMLASCPVLCGSAGEVLGLHCGHSQAHSAQAPLVPSPSNDDDCVCNGAIRASDAGFRLGDLDPAFSPLSLDTAFGLVGLIDPRAIMASAPVRLPNGHPPRGTSIPSLLPVSRC
jgi:hypothetical protein